MTQHADLPPGLGPWCVGVRVVVRRVLPGQLGPTGGPAMTDLLGVMEEWGADTVTLRSGDGSSVVVERRLIVSGKPVPPRPSVRSRSDPHQVAVRAASTWPALSTGQVGDWLLRASAGFTLRANSALLAGEPGLPWSEAIDQVTAFYRAHALPVRVQTLGGTPAQARLEEAGWTDARTGMREVLVQLAGVAGAVRALRRQHQAQPPRVELTARLPEGWLATDRRAMEHRAAATAVLEGPEQVAFACVTDASGVVVARGRVALSDEGDVWAGISDVWVDPGSRRQRLGSAVLGAVLGWAAEHGASTAFLQAAGDNRAALAMYERLGFVTHHTYRYLAPPRH